MGIDVESERSKQIRREIDTLIEEYARERGWETDGERRLSVTKWILFAEQQAFSEDGQGYSATLRISSEPDPSWSDLVGLVRTGQLRLESNLLENGDDD